MLNSIPDSSSKLTASKAKNIARTNLFCFQSFCQYSILPFDYLGMLILIIIYFLDKKEAILFRQPLSGLGTEPLRKTNQFMRFIGDLFHVKYKFTQIFAN